MRMRGRKSGDFGSMYLHATNMCYMPIIAGIWGLMAALSTCRWPSREASYGPTMPDVQVCSEDNSGRDGYDGSDWSRNSVIIGRPAWLSTVFLLRSHGIVGWMCSPVPVSCVPNCQRLVELRKAFELRNLGNHVKLHKNELRMDG
jgi:hypothetical protein